MIIEICSHIDYVLEERTYIVKAPLKAKDEVMSCSVCGTVVIMDEDI